VTRLRHSGELRIPRVALRLGANEDSLSRPHGLRHRVVAGEREAAKRVDVPAVVAAHRHHLEPLAVLAQRRDQAGAGLGRAHALHEDGVEHLLRRPGPHERVGDELETEGRVERPHARGGLLLRPLASPQLPREDLAAEDSREEEDAERERSVRLHGPRVVRRHEEVVEGDDRQDGCDEPVPAPAERGRDEHHEHVEERRDRLVRGPEREQGDSRRPGDGDESRCHGPRRGMVQPVGGLREGGRRGAAGHPSFESSRFSRSRSPRATRSRTPRTSPDSSTGSNGFTT
jgi:hypothetical protein